MCGEPADVGDMRMYSLCLSGHARAREHTHTHKYAYTDTQTHRHTDTQADTDADTHTHTHRYLANGDTRNSIGANNQGLELVT